MSVRSGRLEEKRAGNIMQSSGEGSTQNDYYNFMLRQAKLAAAVKSGVISTPEENAINLLGDLEKWELKVMARLSLLGDNSPELLQFLHITNTTTREACAKKLATKQYKKQLVENALSTLLTADEVKSDVNAKSAKSRSLFTQSAFGLQGA